MSKKSRRRNKKILGLLAAGLGATALMRGRGTAAANVDSGRGGDSASAKARVVANAPISAPIRKDVMPVPAYNPKQDKNLYNEWDTIINAPEVKRPIRKRTNIYSDSGAMFKKGGRVTGIAKRGFGRALKKK